MIYLFTIKCLVILFWGIFSLVTNFIESNSNPPTAPFPPTTPVLVEALYAPIMDS